ncbi:hypothetical protein [Apilactobacillus timberlakei]|uniref:Uncharacterized protein n=1 Tax=Apilactobacillus timberlakei TaxID=2008380 RepID=A0ABY2YRS1_9LACO|nr:hypothetical protein [Apilactobacillus timberlakei]TPR12741.1 hypothetical protein DY048_06945 [Apilactobacillus timberlakei]TPR13624.1 hypothetical protein DY052_07815 [Apilactobacillus timberlakei]
MDAELMQKVQDNLKTNYAELFDDSGAEDKLNFIITRAYTKCRQYKDKVSNDELIMLLTLYSAYLLKNNQSADGSVTTAKADIFQAQFSSNSQGSNNYLSDFMDLLNDLGLSENDWKIQIG